MLRSLWLRLSSSLPSPDEERELARYYRDEGLHAQLALRELGDSRNERTYYAARSYFAA
jgi:hypothetical protein